MRFLPSILGLMISTILTSSLWAQDTPEERPGREEMRQMAIEQFDADGDGQLNEEERAKAREEMRGRMGRRGGPQRPGPGPQAGPPPERGPREGRFGRRGGPGGPPPSREPGRRGPEGPRSGSPLTPDLIFETFDVDHDGQLTREEFDRIVTVLRMARTLQSPEFGGQMGMRPRGGAMGPPPGRGGFNDSRGRGPERGERPGPGGPPGRRGFRGNQGPPDMPERPRRPRLEMETSAEESATAEETV